MADLVEGALITPSVRLVRHLGAGGMGSVWVADHLTLQTQVVVKFMSKELAKDAASVARFSREAAAAAQVKSPHVVQTFDHGIVDGLPFIVMELLDGEDLAHRLLRTPLLPTDDVALIVSQVARALSRAHERGVVHRDIKPDNIFLCDAGGGEIFVKVLDFGVAKYVEEQHLSGNTATGQMVGTPVYMSPEQLTASKEIDFRADLWSLGVVAYQALTGSRPFGGETVAALAIAIHTGDYAPPSRSNPSLPTAVDAWFARACAKEPSQRFASAKEMAAAFRVAAGAAAEETTTLAVDRETPQTLVRPPTESDFRIAMQKTQAAGSQTIPVQAITDGAPRPRPAWMIPAFVVAIGALGVGVFLLTSSSSPNDVPKPASSVASSASSSVAAQRPPPVAASTSVAASPRPSTSTSPSPSASASALASAKPSILQVAPVVPLASAKPKALGSTSAKTGNEDDIE